jgi:hypothetical protein
MLPCVCVCVCRLCARGVLAVGVRQLHARLARRGADVAELKRRAGGGGGDCDNDSERVLSWLRLLCLLVHRCPAAQDALRDCVQLPPSSAPPSSAPPSASLPADGLSAHASPTIGLFVLLSHCSTDVTVPLAREWYQ